MDEPDELYLRDGVVNRRRDVLIVRGDRLICVRCTKTGEVLVPETFFNGLMPWDIAFAIVLSIVRRLRSRSSKQWQVGVFWQAHTKNPGIRTFILERVVFDGEDEALGHQQTLVERVNAGEFDSADPR